MSRLAIVDRYYICCWTDWPNSNIIIIIGLIQIDIDVHEILQNIVILTL